MIKYTSSFVYLKIIINSIKKDWKFWASTLKNGCEEIIEILLAS